MFGEILFSIGSLALAVSQLGDAFYTLVLMKRHPFWKEGGFAAERLLRLGKPILPVGKGIFAAVGIVVMGLAAGWDSWLAALSLAGMSVPGFLAIRYNYRLEKRDASFVIRYPR